MKHSLTHFLTIVSVTSLMFVVSCKDDPVVPVNEEGVLSAESPRYLEAVDSLVYFTCYYPTAVARYSPATGRITSICHLGQFHPEGLAAAGGKLFIASSNISDERYNYTYDNKLYIVDIATFTLVDSVTTGVNPQKVKRLDDTHIAFNTWGDYRSHPGGTYIMDINSLEITDLHIELTNFDIHNGDIYGYHSDWNDDGSTDPHYYKIDGNSHEVTEILTDFHTNDSPYGINVDPLSGNIVVTTDGNYTSTGDCHLFSPGGTPLMNPVEVGVFPSKALFAGNNRILILNEGGWGQNNAGVSLVNTADTTARVNFFSEANGRGLGDIAQDMIIVGDKAYITITFSNSIETMDITTGVSSRFSTTK